MQRSDQPVGGPEFMVDGIADVGIAVAIGEELACVSPPLFSADGTEGRPRAGLSECPGPAAPGGFPLFICAHARTHTHTHMSYPLSMPHGVVCCSCRCAEPAYALLMCVCSAPAGRSHCTGVRGSQPPVPALALADPGLATNHVFDSAALHRADGGMRPLISLAAVALRRILGLPLEEVHVFQRSGHGRGPPTPPVCRACASGAQTRGFLSHLGGRRLLRRSRGDPSMCCRLLVRGFPFAAMDNAAVHGAGMVWTWCVRAALLCAQSSPAPAVLLTARWRAGRQGRGQEGAARAAGCRQSARADGRRCVMCHVCVRHAPVSHVRVGVKMPQGGRLRRTGTGTTTRVTTTCSGMRSGMPVRPGP